MQNFMSNGYAQSFWTQECYFKEGVNHHAKCEKIARDYFRRITRPDFKEAPVEMSDITE